jgi:hypothetical protein
MTEPALIDADCEAFGHPTECQEPAPGTVQKDSSHGITVTVDGVTREIGTIDTATINFPEHSHSYNGACVDNESHQLDPDTGNPNITINGSPIYEVDSSVTTDPKTDGSVDIASNIIKTNINTV